VTTDVFYNPFEPGFAENPYDQYRALREADPVHCSPFGVWVLTRYDDVLRFLRDPELSVEQRNAVLTPMQQAARDEFGDLADEAEFGSLAMLNRDPPDHTRLRRLVSKAFTPRTIERLRPHIERLVDDALDAAAERGEMELIGELAFPLPFQVISEMLGMPDTDRDQLREWSGTLVRSLEPIADLALVKQILEAGEAMATFITGVIDDKRRKPADDMLSVLIAAEDEGDVLSDDELLAQVMLIYIAGHETTVNLIGNGTLALLRDRAQLERWRDDPSLDAAAIDELLRYDSPVQMSRRITLQDITLEGRNIPKGSFLGTSLAAANRDPARWGGTAERVDVTRADAREHVSFGGGSHYCLGAALARLEGQVAVGRLIRRFPALEIAGEPVWNGRINLRGLDRLPLAVR
jgi:cytochrome P450